MVLILLYELAFIIGLGFTSHEIITNLNSSLEDLRLLIYCILIGGFGGTLYCLRGIYINYCVRSQWDIRWWPWYIIRPIASLLCGGVSYLFLKAGLLVLEAEKQTGSTNLGFYALSFIAGLNVDNFISKIEDLAQATWGITKSNASTKKTDN